MATDVDLQIKKNWYKEPNVLYSDRLGVVAEESSSFMEKHGILNSPNNGRDVLLLLVARWSVGIRGCRGTLACCAG
jgi:hypothetical protein